MVFGPWHGKMFEVEAYLTNMGIENGDLKRNMDGNRYIGTLENPIHNKIDVHT